MKTKVVTRKKIFLVSLAHVFLLFAMNFGTPPVFAQEMAKIKLNPRVTEPPTAPGPGGVFFVFVEVHAVEHMYGYEFKLQWNPGILEFVNYIPNEPFVYPWPTIVEPGQAEVAWSYFPGEPEGFTPEPCEQYPVGSFVFNVVGSGYSELDLKNTKMVDVWAHEIEHVVLDGYFINVPPVEEADFTAWKAKAEYQPNWDMSVEPNTLRGRIWNKGTVGLSAKVVFNITKDGFSETFDSNVVSLAPGQKETVYYDLTAADIDDTLGTYTVKAQVSYWKIIGSQPTTPNGATIKTFSFNANP